MAAWALLDEALHWAIAVGGVLVLLGVRLTQGAHVRPPSVEPVPSGTGQQAA